MNFLQDVVVPRIEATEQFQSAIQAELDAAGDPDGADPDGLKPGDDGAASHQGDPAGATADGGTRAGAASSPSNAAPAGAPVLATAGAAPAGGEFQAVMNAVVELQRRFDDKENQERETQLENAMTVIKDKTEALVEYARKLEGEKEVLLEALKTGAPPVKQSPSEIFLDTGTPTDFQSRVAKYVADGKTKTEAVMLARKDDPHAHTTWLESQGVITTL
jgi:hypothetical protein